MTPDGKQVSEEPFVTLTFSKKQPPKHTKFLSFVKFSPLTDHSQPSHAIHLLCIRWRSCKFLPQPSVSLKKVQCPFSPLLMSSLHLFFFQDTTDYVAYVAKDPVNRRGKSLSQIPGAEAAS